MTRLFLALAFIVLPLAALSTASPAYADESACAGSYYDQSGFEFFTPELRYVPPPLRVAAWDCAVRDADRPFGLDTGSAVEYTLVYADVDFDVVVRIARAFEEQGWLTNFAAITSIDTGEGMQNSVLYSADQLAALDSPPLFAGGRFGNAATNHDIISLSYADGDAYTTNGGAFTTPSLVIDVALTEAFAGDGIADPSVLSGLKSIGDVAVTPAGAAAVGGTAVVLTLVIGYPGSLLNSVIGPRYDQFVERMRKRRAARRSKSAGAGGTGSAVPDQAGTPARSRLFGWLFVPGLLIASVISGFVDPSFGLNAMSARLLVTAFLSLLVFNVAAWFLVRVIMRRRHPDAVATVKFRWGSLILVTVAVLIARLLEFHPGIIFGLVAGLVFATTMSKAKNAMVVILGTGFGLAVALLAWVGFSVVAPIAAGAPGNLLLVSASEFFSAVTIEGIASLPLALLPLLALDGHKLFDYNKWLWLLCYVIGLLAFMLVLLTIPNSWGEIDGDFVRWIVLFCVFGVVAVAVWAIHTVFERRKAAATAQRVPG
ncbi:hypothetical protein BKA04_000733 [Cryobacterium mesophilum]|uniref:hypothetical protein n=1 Tax=Terrimesophilobacter mesophilus TaxID=433647 RepID=UPI00106BD2F6|nr:hypothetical protein [Terrimesophilobacter mesophilus]MBB5632510.1 hypothetical protein [Terrimesophilobacter mesophilus]